ncbi:MAG: hypothetical protein E7671_00795 [Ruminococcaceae bacterium]|nr:hypothetical protein [Oscillospiraceae bacterium]
MYCVESETFLETETENITVYIAPTGKRYHNKRTCAGKNALPIDLNLAKNYHTACKKCVG